MDLTLKYSKTSKGAKAVLARSRALPSNALLVLSNIDGKTPASAILAKLQLNEEKFTKALVQLLDEAFIQVVQDFGPSVFDLNAAIEVSEISTEEFLKLELPEEQDTKTQDQIEAEARALAYAEEQARKEAQAREQEEAERKLLIVTDILAKSGHKIDIEKLAEAKPAAEKSLATPASSSDFMSSSIPAPSVVIRTEEPMETGSTQAPAAYIPAPSTLQYANSIDAQESATVTDEARLAGEEQARLIERQQREEEAPHKKAEDQARFEAEAQAKMEAERKAKEEVKRRNRAKAVAEARAREEAARKAEEKARKAEEKAYKEEERRLRKEAEAARKLAEQRAREEEKARLRAEAERKAQEKAERSARDKAAAEARARELAAIRAKEQAELEARRAVEAKAKAEAVHKAKEAARLRKEALAAQKTAAREEARRRAEAKAILRAEAWAQRRQSLSMTATSILPRLIGVARPLLISAAILFVALLLLLQFISLRLWTQPVEQLVARNIGEPVQIRDLRASLWPKPHLILEDVAAGPLGDITARSIQIYPELLTFWKPLTILKTVEIEGMSVDQLSVGRVLKWVGTTGKKQEFQIDHVVLQKASVKVPEVELPLFNADVALNTDSTLKSATLTANNLVVGITPENGHLSLNLEAQGWQSPLGPALIFDELTAKGVLEGQQMRFNKMEGLLYGGSIKGALNIDWASGWSANGNFELARINLALVTPVISEQAHLHGRLDARAELSSSADNPLQLAQNASIRARFEAQHGEVGGLDLARAASGREQVGGVTRFEVVSGDWNLQGKQYQLSNISLKAGSLSAHGDITITSDQELSGKVQTRLDLSSRQLQGRFSISGKLGNARISR